jgi:hypothetical protein
LSEVGVLIQCSEPFLNFSLCSTFLLLPSSLPNVLPPIQPTFTRKTSRHCLGTFIAVNLSLFSSLHVHTLPPTFPSLSFASRQRVKVHTTLFMVSQCRRQIPSIRLSVCLSVCCLLTYICTFSTCPRSISYCSQFY